MDTTSIVVHSTLRRKNESAVGASNFPGFVSAAADMMLFSKAHFHVISFWSGFGQKAAFLASTSMNEHVYFVYPGLSCRLLNFVRPKMLANHFSGV